MARKEVSEIRERFNGLGTLIEEVKKEIYRGVVNLGGVIAAEYDPGRTRIQDMAICLDKKEIELMKGIRKLFDPSGILNFGYAVEAD